LAHFHFSPYRLSLPFPCEFALFSSVFRVFSPGDARHRFGYISRHFFNVAFCVTVSDERAHPLKYQQPLRLPFRAA
jgi:hypothetical protein